MTRRELIEKFIGAAIFGMVAGKAVVKGEAVAGDGFKGGAYTTGKDVVVEQGMNIHIKVNDDSHWLGEMLKREIEKGKK